jgi:hypothetical protein
VAGRRRWKEIDFTSSFWSAHPTTSGKASNSVDYKPAKELKAAQGILAVIRGGFPADMCVCDPKIPGVWGTFIGGDDVHK